MNNTDGEYKRLLRLILEKGVWKGNRTGIKTLAVAGAMFQHDMSEGFPILTTKRVPFRLVASELEFFIKGLNSKKWLQERNNHIWDEWCNPQKIPYGNDTQTKQKMFEEDDLGDVYGRVWRGKSEHQKVDQLAKIVETLHKNPNDRRMVCSAWSPMDIPSQALPPCHISFGVVVIEDKLNLWWMQRSCCVGLGIPFNISSYGLLLHLLAKEAGLKEGILTGFFADLHAYENYVPQLREQLTREPFEKLPTIQTDNFKNIFEWEFTNSRLINYQSHPPIKMEIAV
jgi:thymidylate synthase